MRLSREHKDGPGEASGRFLYQGVEVGYAEDIVAWAGRRSLERGIRERLSSLDVPVRRINTTQEADEYFRSASLLKEMVFFSYAGKDEQAAAPIVAVLRERFQRVFDYRDGESIRPGHPWLDEIFTQLSASAVGVPLLSTAYVRSGNCMHELREMVAQRDADAMQLVPIVLDEQVEIPAFVRDQQYLPRWRYDRADALVDALVRSRPGPA